MAKDNKNTEGHENRLYISDSSHETFDEKYKNAVENNLDAYGHKWKGNEPITKWEFLSQIVSGFYIMEANAIKEVNRLCEELQGTLKKWYALMEKNKELERENAELKKQNEVLESNLRMSSNSLEAMTKASGSYREQVEANKKLASSQKDYIEFLKGLTKSKPHAWLKNVYPVLSGLFIGFTIAMVFIIEYLTYLNVW